MSLSAPISSSIADLNSGRSLEEVSGSDLLELAPDEAAPAAPESAEEAWAIGKMMIEAFKSKNWGLAVGLLLMLIVFLLRKTPVLTKVPTKAMPWVAAGLGVVGTISTGLASGVVWYEALVHGLFLGAAATGLCEMVFKHLGKKAPAEEETAAAE